MSKVRITFRVRCSVGFRVEARSWSTLDIVCRGIVAGVQCLTTSTSTSHTLQSWGVARNLSETCPAKGSLSQSVM